MTHEKGSKSVRRVGNVDDLTLGAWALTSSTSDILEMRISYNPNQSFSEYLPKVTVHEAEQNIE